MKKNPISQLHPRFLAGLATTALALCFVPTLLADDHGHGGGHGGEGGDDGGGSHEVDDASKTEFLGTIQSLPGTGLVGAWTVDGRTVNVTSGTTILSEHGAPAVGGKVEVEGPVLADGSVQATKIKTEDGEMEREDNVFFGAVESLPATADLQGVWRVGGLTVLVNAATRIEAENAAPTVGSLVRVEGVQQPDASIVANEIEVQSAAVANAQAASAPIHFRGVISKLPGVKGHHGNWVIDDVIVTVTDDSRTTANSRKAKVGRLAIIKGVQQINGSLVARRVKIKNLPQ